METEVKQNNENIEVLSTQQKNCGYHDCPQDLFIKQKMDIILCNKLI